MTWQSVTSFIKSPTTRWRLVKLCSLKKLLYKNFFCIFTIRPVFDFYLNVFGMFCWLIHRNIFFAHWPQGNSGLLSKSFEKHSKISHNRIFLIVILIVTWRHFRQYREQLRQQRQQQPPASRLGYIGLNGSAPANNGSSSSVLSSTSELSQTLSEKLQINNATTTTSEMNAVNNDVNNRYKSYDMKAMQKEAVLSYVKV